METMRESLAMRSGCAERNCVVTSWFDRLHQYELVQHGDNPEAVLQTSRLDIVHNGVTWYEHHVIDWIVRIHEYEDGRVLIAS